MMDEKNISLAFMALLGIAETLRDCISDINKVYEEAGREVFEIWRQRKKY